MDIIESTRIVGIFVELRAERTINFAHMNVHAGVYVLQAMQNQVILEFAFRAMLHFVHLIDFGNKNTPVYKQPTEFGNKVSKNY